MDDEAWMAWMENNTCYLRFESFMLQFWSFPLISTQGETSEPSVRTHPRVALFKGSQGLLQCVIEGDFDAVQWNKGPNPTEAEILVVYDNLDDYWKKWGQGYQDGLYNINSDYSLVINTVGIWDSGRYTCEVFFTNIGPRSNHTDANVLGKHTG